MGGNPGVEWLAGWQQDIAMSFSPESLCRHLLVHPRPTGYVVAYSGGLDSHVLLDALARLRARLGVPVAAVHVNHGLQAAANDWQTHCAAVCHALCVLLTILPVDASAARGESPEAAARVARYRALAGWLPDGYCLLSAQHQDDQAETVLLQLVRGSGVHGLAAMPEYSEFGHGSLLRPLLTFTRDELRQYAQAQQLRWVEDPSNDNTAFTRNFLRHHVLDSLRERWPQVSSSLSRSAANQAEAAQLLDELADADLATLEGGGGTLLVPALARLAPARQRNALRRWLRRATGTVPSRAVLVRITHDMLTSRIDAGPCVRWGDFELRRYRTSLYLLHQDISKEPAHPPLHWSLDGPLALPGDGGVLVAVPGQGQGIRQSRLAASGVQVGWRMGGERCRPAGRNSHHELRKLFQERGIPPWERSRIPLIFIDGALAAVPGLWVCEPFQAHAQEAGVQIYWQKPLWQVTPSRA
jgi:tRNA(Ile)-lysidine synthase